MPEDVPLAKFGYGEPADGPGCQFWPTRVQCAAMPAETLVYVNENLGELRACADCFAVHLIEHMLVF